MPTLLRALAHSPVVRMREGEESAAEADSDTGALDHHEDLELMKWALSLLSTMMHVSGI